MAEFTKDIQQLRQTATQQPSIAPPSQSLAGDVVNLIGTGLDFYAKGQAQDRLDLIKKKDLQDERDFSSGVLGLRELEQGLMANGVSGNTANFKVNNFMRRYSPEVALKIFQAKKALTGKSSNDVASDLDKAQAELKDKQEQTQLQGSAYAIQVLGMDDIAVANLTPYTLEGLSKRAKLMEQQINVQKQIMEVSDDITSPILEISRNILQRKVGAQLDGVRDANRSGDTEGAIELGNQLRQTILQATTNAPRAIRDMMASQGKGAFVDEALINSYTKELSGMLNDPTIKSVLSGKETDEETTNSVINKMNYILGGSFFKNLQAVKGGDESADSINDFKNTIEYFTGKGFGGTNVTKSTEKTLYNALGVGPPPPPTVKTNGTDSSVVSQDIQDDTSSKFIDIAFAMLNRTVEVYSKLNIKEISEVNDVTSGYIQDKLDTGKELSEADMLWVENSLTFGNTGTTEKRGKGASKAVLGAPLKVLAHPNYEEKVKPAVDRARANGIDPVAALTSSLDNHIKNNYNNAYTRLVGLGTSGMAISPTTRISDNTNRGRQGSYNLRDVIELNTEKGALKFKYKAGTLGQMTDVVKIQNLRNLNSSLVVLNDYVKAIANVTETEEGLVADEIRGLLGRYVNIPLPEDVNNKE